VSYSDESLACVAESAERYLSGRVLPGNALQLMDAAGVRVKLLRGAVPEEIAEVQKRLRIITTRLEGAIQNHEFEKARFYSDEERKQRENLGALHEKYASAMLHSGIVSREDVEATMARWAEYPFQP
jgi:ATP-dependent Clp protease ATP-binding subunit ClpC